MTSNEWRIRQLKRKLKWWLWELPTTVLASIGLSIIMLSPFILAWAVTL